MKKLLIFIFLISVFTVPAFALKEKNTVKVGITTQNFSQYEHTNARFISDNIIKITDMGSSFEIEPVEANKILSVSIKDDFFNVYIDNELAFDKLTGPIVLSSNAPIGIVDLNRKGSPAKYLGMIEIKKSAKHPDKFYIINAIDLQNYLRGVTPNEMPISFGLEALKAQAIAARNYVTNANINPDFDVVDSTSSQVYYGYNSYKDISDRAVNETKGIYALYNNKPILALYFSTSPGITDSWDDVFNLGNPSSAHPYLKPSFDDKNQTPLKTEEDVIDFYSKKAGGFDTNSPKFRWDVIFDLDELEQILKTTIVEQSRINLISPKVNNSDDFYGLKEIKATKRTVSGKIIELEIVANSGTYKVKKELVIRRLFKKGNSALPSANFYIEEIKAAPEHDENQNKPQNQNSENNNIFNILDNIFAQKTDTTGFKFVGGGFGHGVGMSQFGAYNLSKQGKKYPEILKHYYKGVELATLPNTVYFNEYGVSYKNEFYFDPSINKKVYLFINNPKKVSEFPFKINEYEFDDTKGISGNTTVKIDITQYLKKGLNTIVFSPLTAENKGKTIEFKVEF